MIKYILRSLFQTILVLLCTALAIGAIFQHYNYVAPKSLREFERAIWPPAPCSEPITYSLGTIDNRFGASEPDLLAAIDKASSIWGGAIDRKLFQYSTTSPDMLINFVYDYRQQATSDRGKLDSVINSDKAGYDTLKAKYNNLYQNYTLEKTKVQADLDAYNVSKQNYQSQVDYWNAHGGAPAEQYQKLQNDLAALNLQGKTLNAEQATSNKLVDTLNATVNVLNRLSHELNLNVNDYNTIGSSAGEEFSEAEYVEDVNGRRIDVYEFDSQTQLVRVLEHELGHALGLAHVEDPNAIMYRLNQGQNENLAAADISELKQICQIDAKNK